MANFGFIIDNRRCIGCHACTVACKSEHDVPIGVNRTWVKYIEKGTFPDSRRLFSVMRCNHCDDAPCVTICPVTALFRRSDGIVDFDNRRCIGCKACMQACPYDALYIDPDTRTAAKCNYCAHRVDLGLEPACVNVCPTRAIVSGDLDDPDSAISRLKSRQPVSVRKPEKGTLPQLFYIDGDRHSLEPMATSPGGDSLWGGQTGGVGHFAGDGEQPVAGNGQAAQAAPLASQTTDGELPDHAAASGSNVPHPLDGLRQSLGLLDPVDGVLEPSVVPDLAGSGSGPGESVQRSYDTPNKGVLWGWPVSAYVWTKAIAAGSGMVLAAAALFGNDLAPAGIQWTAWLMASLFLGLTGFLLVVDLDQPKRFAWVLLRPQWRSWLVRGAVIISVYAALLAVWLYRLVLGHGIGQGVLAWLVLVCGGLTAVYTAFLFAQARGRDFWQSPLLAVHMLVHSLMAGAATLCVAGVFSGFQSWQPFLSIVLAVALPAKLLVDACELCTSHTTADGRLVVRMITRGRFRHLYRYGVVLGGCILPLLIVAGGPVWLYPLAGLLVLGGLFVAEHLWVRVPQLVSLG